MTTTDLTLHRPDDRVRPDDEGRYDEASRPDPRLHRGHQHVGPTVARRPRADAAERSERNERIIEFMVGGRRVRGT